MPTKIADQEHPQPSTPIYDDTIVVDLDDLDEPSVGNDNEPTDTTLHFWIDGVRVVGRLRTELDSVLVRYLLNEAL